MSPRPEHQPVSVSVPPWLWLWIPLFLAGLPGRLRLAGEQVAASIESERRLGEAGIGAFVEPGGWLKLTATQLPLAVELAPPLVLCAGLLLAAFPQRRARAIERGDRLAPLDPGYPSPTLAELRAFVERHAPGIEHRVNIGASQNVARVFARRPFRSVLGIYGGALRVWRKDRAAGEAIVLHELAHHRQGDATLLGTGEPLPWAIRTAPLLFLVFLLAPLAAVALQQAAMHAKGVAEIGEMRRQIADVLQNSPLPADLLTGLPSVPGFWSSMYDSLANFFQLSAPMLPLMVAQDAAWLATAFVLPVAAIWCSELNADRFAELGRPGALARWLAGHAPPPVPWHRRAMGFLSHPPSRMRVWLARHAHEPRALVALLLLFPAAYVLRFVTMLAWGASSHVAAMRGTAGLAEAIPVWGSGYAQANAPIFAVMGGIVAAWPELARLWERRIAGVDARPPARDVPAYRLVGAGIAAAGLLGFLLTRG